MRHDISSHYMSTHVVEWIKLNLNLNLNNDAIDRRAAHKAIDTVMVFYLSDTQLYRIYSVVKCKSGQVRSMDSAKYLTQHENIYIYI